tara:strand:+ start:994 stop:1677 length:684 start_codon:yes stop_codon:yes gene_type:complete
MKIEINVPTSLNEITLGQYQKYLKIAENNPEGNFLDAKMIEIFCGIPLSESYKLKMSSATAILDILNELLNQTPHHIQRFKMNDVEYGFAPDLDELSLGEYIDLDNNVSKWEQMHIAMNVLYRPIKTSKSSFFFTSSNTNGKYNIEEYDVKNPEAMKDMPLGAAIGSVFFLYNLGMELSRHTILYSNNQTEIEAIQSQLISEQNGVGINQFMDSLSEILQDLKISLN